MEALLKMPEDLFRHTMRFHNPQTKTAELISALKKTLELAQVEFAKCFPYRFERKGFQAVEEMCKGFSTFVSPKHPSLFYNWAINPFYEEF